MDNKENFERKEKIKEKLEKIVENLTKKAFEEVLLEQYYEVAEKCINEKPYNIENHLTMIGFAFETNKIISLIKDEKIKEKYDEKGQMIWDKWQEKIKSTVNGFDLMQAINKTMKKETKN